MDARAQRAPFGRREDGYDPPLETWPPPVVVVTVVVAGWIVGVGVALWVVAELDVPLELLLIEDPLVVDVSTSAVVPLRWPEYDAAASVPKAPTAVTPAIAVPIVSARSRATARFRSAGLVRRAAFMVRVSASRPFVRITTVAGRLGPDRRPAHPAQSVTDQWPQDHDRPGGQQATEDQGLAEGHGDDDRLAPGQVGERQRDRARTT